MSDSNNSTSQESSFGIDINAMLNQINQNDSNAESTNSGNQENTFEIDPKFANLDEKEAIRRTAQSMKDSFYSEREKILKELESKSKEANILNLLSTDKNALLGFVKKIDPNLLPSRNISEEIKKTLSAEFPNFKPSRTAEQAEMEDPGGEDDRYYTRLRQLKNQYMTSQEIPDIEEYLNKLSVERQKLLENEERVIKQAIKELNLTDQEVQETTAFIKTLDFKTVAIIKRFLSKFPQLIKSQSASSTAGTGKQQAGISNARQQFLKTFE